MSLPDAGTEDRADKADKGDKGPAGNSKPACTPAIKSKSAVFIFIAVSAIALAADLASKQCVFDWLLGQPDVQKRVKPLSGNVPADRLLPYLNLHRQIFPGLKFTLSTNPGVVFGLRMPPTAVAVVSVITICMVFFFFASSDRRAWSMHLALAFILAGALGNLYDRLLSEVFIPGTSTPIVSQVRDFIDFSDMHLRFWGLDLNYPWIFNVADMLLVAGVILLMINWRTHRKQSAN